jgi:hypothetical protein
MYAFINFGFISCRGSSLARALRSHGERDDLRSASLVPNENRVTFVFRSHPRNLFYLNYLTLSYSILLSEYSKFSRRSPGVTTIPIMKMPRRLVQNRIEASDSFIHPCPSSPKLTLISSSREHHTSVRLPHPPRQNRPGCSTAAYLPAARRPHEECTADTSKIRTRTALRKRSTTNLSLRYRNSP